MNRAAEKLREFRDRRGHELYGRRLTMDEAGALIVIAGEPTGRATWFGWERKGKIPKPEAMVELERLVGVQPNDFYPRPDGAAAQAEPPAQAALAFGT